MTEDVEEFFRKRAKGFRDEADKAEARAKRIQEDNPSYADYLERKARILRSLADSEDGGLG